MLTYISIFCVLALISLSSSKRQTELFFVFLACVFLLVFTGTRFETGCDFLGYLMRYKYFIPYETMSEWLETDEPGFNLLMHTVVKFGLDYMWLNIFTAFIFLVCLYRFLSWHFKPTLVLTLMFPILIVQLSMSGIRQALAVAFFMLALRSFMQQKRFWVAAFIFIGASFHQTLIIFLPMALIVGRQLSTARIIAALAVLGPVAIWFIADRFGVYEDRYIEQIYGSQHAAGGFLRLGLMLVTAVLFEIYRDKMKQRYPTEFPLMRLFSLMIFALIPVVVVSSVAVHRLGYYMLPMQLFTLAALPYVMFEGKKHQQQGQLLPIGLYGTYITVWFSISRHAQQCYIPYESYLFQ